MSRILNVYLKDIFVGNIKQTSAGDLSFIYGDNYSGVAISISIPVTSKRHSGDNVKSFFSGLLPDGSVRNRLASYLGISLKNSFGLLEAVGGDCAGALAIYPQGQKPSKQKYDIEELDDYKLKKILDLIKRRPMLAGDDGYRLSLAGTQDKLAVGFSNGKVLLVKNNTPTTHILKPIISDVLDSAHNELFCMKLAKMVGIDVPDASLHYVDDVPYYLVERYDRKTNKNGDIERIHQEDFCQALGIAPEMKYEREGGPNISECIDLIKTNSAKPAMDNIKLLNITIFNFLIGNADAHGKNFSFLYKNQKPELAPAYDLLSTAVYPDLSEKLAMKIGGKYNPRYIYKTDFQELVPDTKSARKLMKKQMGIMVKKILDCSKKLKIELENNRITSPIIDRVIEVILDRVRKF